MPRATRRNPAFTWRAATPSRWRDVEALFGERGACGGCWCMTWRLARKDFEAGKGAGNKRALRRLVEGGHTPGVLGYLGRECVAWCSVAPRGEFRYLERSRVLAPVDDAPADAGRVWSVSCLFVTKEHRGRGLSVEMLRAAVAFATKQGAGVVEGYPIEPTMERTPHPFVWTGLPSAFRAAGFTEVARCSSSRPMMRCRCAPRTR
jgi:GNAT superfamily N-acetyltransferase